VGYRALGFDTKRAHDHSVLAPAARAATISSDCAVANGCVPDEVPVVFVVDDDISIRESLELLIRSAGWLPETSASAQEFLSRPRLSVANCLILDINLPDLNGLDVQRLVCAERAEMPIIFVTGYGDVPISVEAMKAGAIEFLTKPINEDALLTAIEQALDRSRAMLALSSEVRRLRDRYHSLSHRERQVMARVISGLMNKQIAFELGISEVTVKAHRGQMMRKMMARSLPALVNMSAKLEPDLRPYSPTADVAGPSFR
jgi:FixJ family two-component response regulator